MIHMDEISAQGPLWTKARTRLQVLGKLLGRSAMHLMWVCGLGMRSVLPYAQLPSLVDKFMSISLAAISN